MKIYPFNQTQLERHENVILRQENDKLRAENDLLKQAMTTPICNSCGGPAVPGEISYEQHQLRIENARLKDELTRICALTNKFLGRPLSSSGSPIPPHGLNSNLELAVGRNDFGGLNNAGTSLPMGFEIGDGSMMPIVKPMVNEMQYDRSAFVDVALSAMDELMKMAQMDNPLWIKGLGGGLESLNVEEYRRNFSSCIGMKPSSYATEATKATGLVYLRGLALVEALMDAVCHLVTCCRAFVACFALLMPSFLDFNEDIFLQMIICSVFVSLFVRLPLRYMLCWLNYFQFWWRWLFWFPQMVDH